SPNAFTYGHTPQNARVVITQGLIKILEPEELESVVAHELGHARHWDILVMTLASMIPYIFYLIFRFGLNIGARSRRNGLPFVVMAIASFVLYIVSNYIVLFISRSREYYADRFGGVVTSNPNALSSSLVKIAYGLASMDPIVAKQPAAEQTKSRQRSERLSAMKSIGIFDPGKATNLAMASFRGPNSLNPQGVVQAMQWDLWNPWALYYELGSTHPLPAKRIQALGKLAEHLHQQPLVHFDQHKPESFWDEFFVDLLFKFAPMLLALIGALIGGAALASTGNPGPLVGLAMLGYSLGYLVRLLFSYRGGEYPNMSVAALLSRIKVSNVRPVPCTMTGRVIGRGVPGLIWSEDMVLQDRSGFMFLDYRQPLRIIEFLFGLFRTKWLIGQDVTVQGWYRRAPTPFLEIKQIITADGRRKRSYVYYVKWVWAALAFALSFIVGLGLTFFAL
ncbi:MAG: M48 family metalloprotease, partial [Candidatus Alcyoniella australis]|nr:M48 family metalloprotease [Candidatus Alcyoniella australis]